MSIKDILSFSYLPTESQTASGTTNGGALPGGVPFQNYNAAGAVRAPFIMSEDDASGRWFKFQPGWNTTSTTLICAPSFIWPYGQLYSVKSTGVYYLGYRFKYMARVDTSRNWLPTSVVALGQRDSTGNITNLLTTADFPDFNGTNGYEYYIEIRLDLPNAKASCWIDGRKIRDVAIVYTAIYGSASGGLIVGNSAGVNANTTTYCDLYFKDGYFKEVSDVNDDFPLGPQLIEEVPLDSATAPWTVNGAADLKTALTTPITTVASATTPTVISDLGQTDAVLKFKPVSKPVSITALAIRHSAKRLAGTSMGIGSKIVQGAAETPTTDIPLQLSMTWDLSGGIFDKDLTGAPLTEAAITEMSVVLSPKNL